MGHADLSGLKSFLHSFVITLYDNCVKVKHKKVHLSHGEQFIDFRKAFDYISHGCLWYKIISPGMSGNVYNIIHNMYDDVLDLRLE